MPEAPDPRALAALALPSRRSKANRSGGGGFGGSSSSSSSSGRSVCRMLRARLLRLTASLWWLRLASMATIDREPLEFSDIQSRRMFSRIQPLVLCLLWLPAPCLDRPRSDAGLTVLITWLGLDGHAVHRSSSFVQQHAGCWTRLHCSPARRVKPELASRSRAQASLEMSNMVLRRIEGAPAWT